jgi:predicted DNA-binding transcriptional regulator YafY
VASTSARVLRLLAFLQSRRYWSGEELAERLDVSQRTLRRDIDRLRDLGYRIRASPGVGGGYQLAAGGTMPPLLFDDEEAVAIAVGLRAAAAQPIAGIDDTSVRALAKLVELLPVELRRRVDALAGATEPPAVAFHQGVAADVLVELALACRDARRLRFAYTSREGKTSERLAEPHRLVAVGRRWYLVAWDLVRQDWRTFRVDRLTDPLETGHSFLQRTLPAEDALAFVTASLDSAPARFEVEVTVHAPAERVAREVGERGSVEALDADASRLRMRIDDLSWAAGTLAAIDADFEVHQPAELDLYLRRVGRRFTASVRRRR